MCGSVTQPTIEEIAARVGHALGQDLTTVGNPYHSGGGMAAHYGGGVVNVVAMQNFQGAYRPILTGMWFGMGVHHDYYNARIETAHRKELWRDNFEHRRCLIPVSYFQEVGVSFGRGLAGRMGVEPFYLGGIFTHDFSQNMRSVVLLTQEAQGVIAEYHDRQPVVIDPSEFSYWLDRTHVLTEEERMAVTAQGHRLRVAK